MVYEMTFIHLSKMYQSRSIPRRTILACKLASLLATSLLAFCLLAGCTQIPFSEHLGFGGGKLDPVIPNRMVTPWTDTVLQQPGQPGIRGLGGRIMFFATDEKKSVPTDGTLTIFAYNNTSGEGEIAISASPLKKFVFLPDQLPKHYSKSALGHSYSFWLPWGVTNGPPRELSLIARFEP